MPTGQQNESGSKAGAHMSPPISFLTVSFDLRECFPWHKRTYDQNNDQRSSRICYATPLRNSSQKNLNE